MLTERFDAALLFASYLHRKQTRKASTVPYVSHLLAVTALVIEDGGTEDEAIGALLHDSIEDCGESFPGGRDGLRSYLRANFGGQVLEIVDACTDDEGMEKGKADSLDGEREAWRQRKSRYIEHIRVIPAAALRVSCADKLHNVRSTIADYERIGDELWARFRTKSAGDQLWYFAELARAFSETPLERLPAQLAREVDRLHELVLANASSEIGRR